MFLLLKSFQVLLISQLSLRSAITKFHKPLQVLQVNQCKGYRSYVKSYQVLLVNIVFLLKVLSPVYFPMIQLKATFSTLKRTSLPLENGQVSYLQSY